MKTIDIDKFIAVLDSMPQDTIVTAKILKGVIAKAMEKENKNEKVLVLDEEF